MGDTAWAQPWYHEVSLCPWDTNVTSLKVQPVVAVKVLDGWTRVD